jgi:hypothetical protein
MKHPLALIGSLVVLAGLSACGEKPQVAGTRVQAAPAYMGTGNAAYTAAGWKAGDATSWEEQMRVRTQSGQNEYVRSVGK